MCISSFRFKLCASILFCGRQTAKGTGPILDDAALEYGLDAQPLSEVIELYARCRSSPTPVSWMVGFLVFTLFCLKRGRTIHYSFRRIHPSECL